MRLTRKPGETPLQPLLAAHFAPVPLDALEVTRRDFPHWMRPDLQRGLEGLFAAVADARFFGARLRDRELDFRFADLAEGGPNAIVVGPAVYQDADVGEAAPVRCLVRGLWLAREAGIPCAVLLDVAESFRTARASIEIAVPPGQAAAGLAARLADRLREAAERGNAWRGKSLVLNRAGDPFDVMPAGLRMASIAAVPEVLEPALAARPGRIDQAIEIGLPGEPERRLLVRRYAGALSMDDAVAAEAARRIGRVSPAFIKELMRRAAQTMLERGGGEVLEARDIDRALGDMLGAGGRLGARMLGAEGAIGFVASV